MPNHKAKRDPHDASLPERLAKLAIYAENVMEDEHHKQRLILADGVADLIYEALDEILRHRGIEE